MAYDPEYQRQYYLKNKERILARNHEWEKRNPERVRAYRKKRFSDPYKSAQRSAASRKWERDNPEAILLKAARNRAKKNSLDFFITKDDVVIPEFCPILKLKIIPRVGGHGPQDASPSLDRIDNTQGYIPGNVRVISWLANKMKATASREMLLMFAQNIESYMNETKTVQNLIHGKADK